DDEARAIAVDRTGAVYVTGTSWYDYFGYTTIKYSNTGVLLWTKFFRASEFPLNPAKTLLAVGNNGTIFVAGPVIGETSGEDFATFVYSTEVIPFGPTFSKGLATARDYPPAIPVDRHDNVFVTGPSYSIPNMTGTGLDFATVAYSVSGTPLWTNRFDGPGH